MIKPRLPEDRLGGLIKRMCLRKCGFPQIHKSRSDDRLWRWALPNHMIALPFEQSAKAAAKKRNRACSFF